MVTNLPPKIQDESGGGEAVSALRLWRAFAALVNARRLVRRDPNEATILALCAAEAEWRRAQEELRSAVPLLRPPN